MNRRVFLRFGAAGAAMAVTGCVTENASRRITREKFASLEELPSVMPNAVVKDGAIKGKNACKYVDDVIWFLRDIARQRPKSIFEHPFLGGFKRIHEATGIKVQMNLFYRTDFFYGMDEFTLADMPDTHKAEFQSAADWLKFGFHSLQEFPDYPWINADYSDIAKCLSMTRGEVERFAGDNMFARALIPHWVPMSRDGVKALVDGGIKIMYSTVGSRYAYNGDREALPYGHGMRLENNRKPETAVYTRVSNDVAISASLCGYNHIDVEQNAATRKSNKFVYDPATGMRFRDFCTRPMTCINLQKLEDLPNDIETVSDAEFIGYGNHEQYFFKDYLAYQPDYMVKEMLVAKTLKEQGRKFVFMEELV